MVKCPINRLLVKIDKKYQDKEGNLFIDTTWNPEEFATLKGVVAGIPDRVDAAYYKGAIDAVAKIGDEVWFSYGVVYDYKIQVDGDTPVYKNLVQYNGEEYWLVNYEEVFCVVSDGKMMMPTQFVLLEPIVDERPAISASGLHFVKDSDVYLDRARVVAVPKMDISCKAGDIVPIEQEFLQKYNMFGKQHYIIPTRRLIAVF